MKKFSVLFIFGAFLLFFSCNKNNKKCQFELLPFQYSKDAKWGYVDLSGNEVIEPKFDKMPSYFKEGFALIEKESGFDYINLEGDTLGLKFTSASLFSEGLAFVVRSNGRRYFIDQSFNNKFCVDSIGTEVISCGSFSGGLARFEAKKGKWGFFNSSGKVVIDPKYNKALDFNEGLAYAELAGDKNKLIKMFIDAEGNEKFRLQDSVKTVRSFYEGMAAFEDTAGWGFINPEGQIAIQPEKNWESVTNFNEGYASVNEFGEWGLIDKKGNRILGSKYPSPLIFFNGKATVQTGRGSIFINMKGEQQISSSFEEIAYPFINNSAIVKDGKFYIFISSNGKYKNDKEFFKIDQSAAYDLTQTIISDRISSNSFNYFRHIQTDGKYSFRGTYPINENLVSKTDCYHFIYNDLGKLSTIEYLKEGKISIDPLYSCAKIVIEYTDGFETRTFQNAEGLPISNNNLITIEKIELNANNGRVALNHYDKDNNPISDKNGIFRYVWTLDQSGNRIVEKQYDKNNELIVNNNICSIGYKYDSNGYKSEMRFLDKNDSTIENPNGIGIEKYKYSEKGNLLEISEYDKNANPQGSASIIAHYKYQYDEFGRLLRLEFFDKENKNTVYPNTKISKVEFKYDVKGNTAMKYIDMSGNEINM